jgi:hypothetical protein
MMKPLACLSLLLALSGVACKGGSGPSPAPTCERYLEVTERCFANLDLGGDPGAAAPLRMMFSDVKSLWDDLSDAEKREREPHCGELLALTRQMQPLLCSKVRVD